MRFSVTARLVVLLAILAFALACNPSAETEGAVATNSPTLPAPTNTVERATAEPPKLSDTPIIPTDTPITPTDTPSPTTPGTARTYTYRVVHIYPHDRDAFTQGLVYVDGILYEGTGLYGESTLRKTDLETGQVTQQRRTPTQLFGEGITIWGNKIIQLTWQSRVGFVYDRDSFELLQTFTYPTEGWGLTHDGSRLIMSDGTATLHFLDPDTLTEIGQVQVYDDHGPVVRLNELEYIDGEIYANVWQTGRIARIDPQTGRVTGWIELAGLLSPEDLDPPVDVLNGIAYDAEADRLFVTGKLWPKLFEIELIPVGN